jgi:hypothetical protein
MKQCVPPGRGMNLIQAYKAQLSASVIEQFKSDVKVIMDEVNSDPDRVAGESTRLVELLKERDVRAKVKVHPAFKALPVRNTPSSCSCSLSCLFWQCFLAVRLL